MCILFFFNKKLKFYLHINNQPNGRQFLEKLKKLGQCIEKGYLSQNSPTKSLNHGISWQQKYNTHDIYYALDQSMLDTDIDVCYIKYYENHPVLMTRTYLPGYIGSYLRFPRIGSDPPNIINGFRQYMFGDLTSLSDRENQLLKQAYFESRQGIYWNQGDFIIMDNIQYGHSKEAYTGDLELWVGMIDQVNVFHRYDQILLGHPKITSLPVGLNPDQNNGLYWKSVKNEIMWSEIVPMRIFDSLGNLNNWIPQIKWEFKKYNHLHIVNTGVDDMRIAFTELGFNQTNEFKWGGNSSGRTIRVKTENNLYKPDAYPKHLFLLPHNEILYQRAIPNQIVFGTLNPAQHGGRTMTHSAQLCEDIIRSQQNGSELLNKLKMGGITIRSGFISSYDPDRDLCYIRSWNERFSGDVQINDIKLQEYQIKFPKYKHKIKNMLIAEEMMRMAVDQMDIHI